MKSPERILFFAEGQLGDSLVLMPALRCVKKSLPSAHITVLLFYREKYFEQGAAKGLLINKSECRGAAEVFANNPHVDEVYELDRNSLRSLKGVARLRAEIKCIRFLRANKYDAAVCTFPQDRFVIWSFLSGIKFRIGQKKQSFGFLLSHKPDLDERSDEGVLKYFCRLLEPLGVQCSDYAPFYDVPQSAKVWAEKFFSSNNVRTSEKIICIHPGARDKDRQWPPAQYSELINRLSETNSNRVLLCYGDYDVPYVEEIKKNLNTKVLYVKTGKISELAAVFQKSGLCIVHNSGPRHLAAAAGAKTVALLEKHDHIMWKLYDDDGTHRIVQSKENCSTCSNNNCLGTIPENAVYGARCMHTIKVEDVLREIESMLNQ